MPVALAARLGVRQEVVLTPKMLKKNLHHHPELPETWYQDLLKVLVEDPDLVAVDRKQPRVLIFYRTCEGKYLRAAVLLPHREKEREYLPSVLSLRLAKPKEFGKDIDRAVYWRS
ncbi:MAG: hypothetical protein ACUVSS_15990 [Anaerolineae bacterium]